MYMHMSAIYAITFDECFENQNHLQLSTNSIHFNIKDQLTKNPIYRVCQKKKDILNIYVKSQIINIFFLKLGC